MAEGRGLIGLSPDGKQLAEEQTKNGFLPFLVIAEMRRQGRSLPQMGERPEEFGTRPGGPAPRQGGRNIFCSERTVIYKENGDQVLPWGHWWALAAVSWPRPIIPIPVSKTTGEPNSKNMNGDKRWLSRARPSQTSRAQRSEVLRPVLNLESNFGGSQIELSPHEVCQKNRRYRSQGATSTEGVGSPLSARDAKNEINQALSWVVVVFFFKLCLFKVRALKELHFSPPCPLLSSLLL